MQKQQLKLDDFLSRPSAGPGCLRRFPQMKSVASLRVVDPERNSSAMTATARICDDTIDRVNEVILPEGVRYEDYRGNPVVLYEHGFAGIVLPIGTSEDPETGRLSVELQDDHLSATSWFSQSSKQANQIYGLIDEGVVRATSIQVIPDHDGIFTYSHPDGRQVAVTEAGEMVEWSWCTLGVNPSSLKKSWFASDGDRDHWLKAVHGEIESAGKVLRVGSIGGDRLLPSIRKSLMSLVPQPSATSPGFELEKTMRKTLKPATLRKLTDAKLKSIIGNEEFDEETQEQAKSMLGEEEDEAQLKSELAELTEEDPQLKSELAAGGEGGVEPTTDEPVPQGAMVLRDFHGMVGVMIGVVTDALKPVENVTVREAVTEELETLKEIQATIAGAYGTAYAELPSLETEAGEPAEVEADVQTQMKAMLAGDRRRSFQFAGLRSRLQQLSGAKNLSDGQRKSLAATLSDFDRLSEASRSFKGASENEALKAAVSRLTAQVDGLLGNAGG